MPVSTPPFLFPHSFTLEPYRGDTAIGPSYGPPKTVRCLVEDKQRLVPTADGQEVTSSAALYCPAGTTVLPESRITLRGKRQTVVTVANFDPGGLPLPGTVVVYLR